MPGPLSSNVMTTLSPAERTLAFSGAFVFIAIGALLSLVFNWFVQLELTAVPVRGYIQIEFFLTLVLLLSMFATIVGFLLLFIITPLLRQS